MDSDKLIFIVKKFFIDTNVLRIDEISSGHINMTYMVEHFYNGKRNKFILQSLSKIFKSHYIVNKNHQTLTEHINRKLDEDYFSYFQERWEVPTLIRCKSNNLFFFPFEGDSWRAMKYIDDTFSPTILENYQMSYHVGIGLYKFHSLCSDIDCSKIVQSIKNFHNTNYYIDQYLITIADVDLINFEEGLSKRIQSLTYKFSKHIKYLEYIFNFLSEKSIDRNVIHGDPKLSNFLFDKKHKYVVSIVDLDTISSGFLLTDLADCIRSICNLTGEEDADHGNVCFDANSFDYFLKGYFSLNDNYNHHLFEYLPEFIYIIILELTIRFLTDFLQSNRYFKVNYKTQNLLRAEVQYRLLCSFLSQMPDLSRRLKEIGINSNSTFVSDVGTLI